MHGTRRTGKRASGEPAGDRRNGGENKLEGREVARTRARERKEREMKGGSKRRKLRQRERRAEGERRESGLLYGIRYARDLAAAWRGGRSNSLSEQVRDKTGRVSAPHIYSRAGSFLARRDSEFHRAHRCLFTAADERDGKIPRRECRDEQVRRGERGVTTATAVRPTHLCGPNRPVRLARRLILIAV